MSVGIRATNAGIQFRFDRQRRPITPAMARLRGRCSTSWGLRGVDIALEPGESVGLIGPNGAGKTTLLRLLAGVFVPDEGRVEVRGRIGSLLSTNAGLLSQLTGRENCVLLGVLAGLSRAEAREAIPRIELRTGLGEAIDRPVSSYSQGMRARLGFAVIEQTRPQILLLDEIHEALDHEFRAVVEEYARAVRDSGGIVVAAGHDHTELGRLCRRVVHLERGDVVADGPFAEVTRLYLAEGRST
jgi:ABC-type polysaccharide/polyol phosphate transport system ATPase subunit